MCSLSFGILEFSMTAVEYRAPHKPLDPFGSDSPLARRISTLLLSPQPLLSAPRTPFIETKTKSKTQEVQSHSIECFLPSLQTLASPIPLSVSGNSTSLN